MMINGQWAFDWGKLEDEGGGSGIPLRGKRPIDVIKEHGQRVVSYIYVCLNNTVKTEKDYTEKMAACHEALDWFNANKGQHEAPAQPSSPSIGDLIVDANELMLPFLQRSRKIMRPEADQEYGSVIFLGTELALAVAQEGGPCAERAKAFLKRLAA